MPRKWTWLQHSSNGHGSHMKQTSHKIKSCKNSVMYSTLNIPKTLHRLKMSGAQDNLTLGFVDHRKKLTRRRQPIHQHSRVFTSTLVSLHAPFLSMKHTTGQKCNTSEQTTSGSYAKPVINKI